MHNALLAAEEVGCDALQVFVKNQRQWQAKPFESEQLDQWHAELEKQPDLPIVAHASYLINLGTDDQTLSEKSRAALLDELQRCDQLAIPGLVLHPGAAGEQTTNAAIQRVAKALDAVHKQGADVRCQVLLETTAGQGTTLGRTFEELGAIIDLLKEPERVGICIDTCHVFAAGYDIRSEEGYTVMMDTAAATVGLERIRCWHFNDSVGTLGSHKDRHAHIGEGELGKAGFRTVLADERMDGIPMILETPKGTDDAGKDWDKRNLRCLRLMASQARKHRRMGEKS